jgi:hypothetical protein
MEFSMGNAVATLRAQLTAMLIESVHPDPAIHTPPHRLTSGALRAANLTGSFVASANTGNLHLEMPNTLGEAVDGDDVNGVAGDRTVRLGLQFAKSLKRLAGRSQPAASAQTMQKHLDGLGLLPDPLREPLMAGWLSELALDLTTLPPLLAGLSGAARWHSLDDGDSSAEVELRCGFLAASVLKREGWLRAVPLPLWTMRTGRRDTAPLFGSDAKATVPMLALITESALAATRELDRLATACRQATDFVGRTRASSRMPQVLVFLVETPVVTARALTAHLKVTPQTAMDWLRELAKANLIREATGRKACRGFVL